MNLSIKASDLKDMILKRADEIECDFARHLAAKREIEAMPTGYAPMLAMEEGGDPEQQKKHARAEQEYNSACQADAIARQVQWMRTLAEVVDAQRGDGIQRLEASVDDLVVLNLWPSGRRGEISTAYSLRSVL